MAQLLLIANNYNEKRGGDRGYFIGDVVHVMPDGWQHGTAETPENGFVSIELSRVNEEDALSIYTSTKLAYISEQPLRIGRRAKGINYNSMGIPSHPAANKCAKGYALKAGRSIARHLENDMVLKLRSVIKVAR